MSGLVSVVIPCRNEVKHIEKTVRAILASYYPDIEILVVDGMSEDGTREVLKKLNSEDPRVRTIDNTKKLTPYAFNLGVQNAAGEYVQIVGSRNVLEPDYIPILVEKLKSRPDVGCVGGDYRHVHDSEQGQVISRAMESKFGMGPGNYRTMEKNAYVDTVGVPLYRKAIFTEVGMFDENLTRNQDDDFNFRVRQKGYKILYVHNAQVTYLVRGNLKKAFWQFVQYGYFKVYVNKKHKTMTTLRQIVPALFVAFLMVTVPLTLIEDDFAPLLGLVIFAYVALGLATAGRGLDLLERVQVVAVCFVLHCGYGFGYLAGVWDFLITATRPRAFFQRQTT